MGNTKRAMVVEPWGLGGATTTSPGAKPYLQGRGAGRGAEGPEATRPYGSVLARYRPSAFTTFCGTEGSTWHSARGTENGQRG